MDIGFQILEGSGDLVSSLDIHGIINPLIRGSPAYNPVYNLLTKSPEPSSRDYIVSPTGLLIQDPCPSWMIGRLSKST